MWEKASAPRLWLGCRYEKSPAHPLEDSRGFSLCDINPDSGFQSLLPTLRISSAHRYAGPLPRSRAANDIRKTPRSSFRGFAGLFFSYRCPALCPKMSSCEHGTFSAASPELIRYIIPGAPAGIAGAGSLMMATAASVVRKLDATLVAF